MLSAVFNWIDLVSIYKTRPSDKATNGEMSDEPKYLWRVPRRHIMDARRRAKHSLRRTQWRILLYGTSSFSDNSLDRHLIILSASCPALLLAENTSGVNKPWSTSRILSSYIRCLLLASFMAPVTGG